MVESLADLWPDLGSAEAAKPHMVYQLGPDIPIPNVIPTKGTYATGRVWCLLDQLLTAPSLKEARADSYKITRLRETDTESE